MNVVRSWKSDGSRNVMQLDAAVDNLRQNALDKSVRDGDGGHGPDRSHAAIAARLRRGERLETARAVFWLQGAEAVL